MKNVIKENPKSIVGIVIAVLTGGYGFINDIHRNLDDVHDTVKANNQLLLEMKAKSYADKDGNTFKINLK